MLPSDLAAIRAGTPVFGPDGGFLGWVYAVGTHSLALERGAFLPREWRATVDEVERVDERGVWLAHGRASLERISDAWCGPDDPYLPAALASPIHGWTGFDPPAVEPRPLAEPVSEGTKPPVH